MADGVPSSGLQGFDEAVEIPRDQWVTFFNEFSARHDKSIVTVEVLGSDGDRDVEIRDRPFAGVRIDESGTGEIQMFIGMADNDPQSHLAHSILCPTRVALAGSRSDDLLIRADDGTTTVLRFIAVRDSQKPSGIAA